MTETKQRIEKIRAKFKAADLPSFLYIVRAEHNWSVQKFSTRERLSLTIERKEFFSDLPSDMEFLLNVIADSYVECTLLGVINPNCKECREECQGKVVVTKP